MKKLGNVLYITTPEAYVSLDGENVVVKKDSKAAMRLPLHNLEDIICFNYPGVSPALMGACAERQIGLSFLEPTGRFLARVNGRVKGGLALRKKQYQLAEQESQCAAVAAGFLLGKVANSRKVIERGLRDHALLLDVAALEQASASMKNALKSIQNCRSLDELRGLEGSAARQYFGVFGQLVIQQRDEFRFTERSRRPPLDNMNALLSFLYAILTYEVAAALEAVGLDPYAGFLHVDRPGRPSLALDLMEELRPVFVDRLVLSLVNRRQISGKGFTQKESGGVLMDDETRKQVLSAWQTRKQEEVIHPYLKERIAFGLIPHVQAMLLARFLRGDLDAYPPLFWN
ncbi:MAG: type I-C CRISPR-associated endonuclease Cas1c [Chloroflexota bacterium]